MPRKSEKQREAARRLQSAAVVEIGARAEPPLHFSEFKKDLWYMVTATKPSDWFTADNLPLLESYCQHVSIARRMDAQIDAFDDDYLLMAEGLEHFNKLTDLRRKESGVISTLATKMRLTQQSKYQTRGATTASNKALTTNRTVDGTQASRPWETKQRPSNGELVD